MRRITPFALAGLASLLWLSGVQAADPPQQAATCGNYGTSVHFEKSPSDAAKLAQKEEKLVLVLHVSGLFEDPDFT